MDNLNIIVDELLKIKEYAQNNKSSKFNEDIDLIGLKHNGVLSIQLRIAMFSKLKSDDNFDSLLQSACESLGMEISPIGNTGLEGSDNSQGYFIELF